MENINQQPNDAGSRLALKFGLKCRNPRKEKGRYICHTDKGSYVIGRTFSDGESILLAHYVKEGLKKAGFPDTDRYLTAADGEPFISLEDGLYTAAEYVGGKEARFDDDALFKDILRKTARMHKITSAPGFFKDYKGVPKTSGEYGVFIPGGFEKQMSRLRGFKKTVMRQRRLSDFDVMFLKYYGNYERRLKTSMETAGNSGVGSLLSSYPKAVTFSHNSLKEETVLVKDSGVTITGFDESSTDHFLFDLASMIKRRLRTGVRMELSEIMDCYCEFNPLSSKEMKALYAILLLPDKFYNTCIKYYSKKRTWTPAAFEGVMEDISGRGDTDEKYVTGFFQKFLQP